MTRYSHWPTRTLAPLVAGVVLAACSSPSNTGAGWTKSGVTPAETRADSRACKREADRYALDRVHQPDRVSSDRYGGRGDTLAADPLAQVDRAEARTLYRQFYEDCMRARGYHRADGGVPASVPADAPAER